jgi:hypothetical protein
VCPCASIKGRLHVPPRLHAPPRLQAPSRLHVPLDDSVSLAWSLSCSVISTDLSFSLIMSVKMKVTVS